MKAEEIRRLGDEHWNHADSVDSRYMVSMVAEIAAQLAEANESLKCLAHPPMKVTRSDRNIVNTGHLNSGSTEGPISIQGEDVYGWNVGDRILVDGNPWIVSFRLGNYTATLIKEVDHG